MITIEDIKKIRSITFNKYEEYVSANYDTDQHEWVSESFYRDHPGDNGEIREFSYGCLSHGQKLYPDTSYSELLITPDYMTGSDYSGTTVELSNYQVFKEKHGSLNGVYDVYGGYSTFAIAISVKWLLDPVNEEKANEIIETLKALDDCPLLDDEHLSNLESDLELDYITKDWSKYELPKMIRDKLNVDPHINPDNAWSLYRELSELSDTYPNFETNGWPYIDDDELKKVLTIELLKKNNIAYEVIT